MAPAWKLRVGLAVQGILPAELSWQVMNCRILYLRLQLLPAAPKYQRPNLPFSLDLQLEKNGDIVKLVSRELALGETRGRLDITVADRARSQHVAGNVALGVIDADAWINSIVAAPEKNTRQESEVTAQEILKGALDFTIEGVKLGSGIGQRVDAVVSFSEDGPAVTSMQALLPGATSFTFSGALNSKNGGGTIALNSGNLKGLMAWLNVETPTELPVGRLAAAKVVASFVLNNDNWTLDNITGEVDSTKFTGGLSGNLTNPVPAQILLRLDELNLDSYIVATNSEEKAGEFRVPELQTAIDIEVSELLYQGAALEKVKLTSSISDGKIEITHLSAEQLGATFIGNGDYGYKEIFLS